MTGSEESLHVFVWSVHMQEEVFFTFEVNFVWLPMKSMVAFFGIYCAAEGERRRPSENV